MTSTCRSRTPRASSWAGSPPPWSACASSCAGSPPRSSAAKPKRRPSSAASSKACSRWTPTPYPLPQPSGGGDARDRRHQRARPLLRRRAHPTGADGVGRARSAARSSTPARGERPSHRAVRRRDGSEPTRWSPALRRRRASGGDAARRERHEAARRLRDAILANVSHEFKTPLSAQLASIELLRDSLDRPTRERRCSCASLERGTLRLAAGRQPARERPHRGRQPGFAGAVRSRAVVEDAAELAAPLFEQRAQRLELELPDRCRRFRATRRASPRCSSTCSPTPTSSRPRIGVRVGGGGWREVVLGVEDEGPGRPAGEGGSIFERFVRARQSSPGGMGLGLSIVKSIVEAHGGASTPAAPPRAGDSRSLCRAAAATRARRREPA